MNATLGKVMEQLRGPGCTNTPEPEEIKESGIREYKPQVHPNNALISVKPIRQRRPNRTFQRYCPELWSIIATRLSVCPHCKGAIRPGEEITLFEKVPGWSHLFHATDEVLVLSNNRRLGD